MDAIQRKLLFELSKDCRQSNAEIGRKIGVSKQVISYRIKQLEEKGVVESYSTLIDWRKLGFNAIRVYLKWKNINPKVEEEIYEHVKKNPLFMWSVKFEGEFDLALYVWVKGVKKFSERWKDFMNKYKKYIMKEEIYESVEMVHYPMKTLAEDHSLGETVLGSRREMVEYDDMDFELLKMISENARAKLVDLAEALDVTPKAVMYRLNNLKKKGIIKGYNAILNMEKIGYNLYKVDFYLNDLNKMKEMEEFAKRHKNIIYLMRTFGGPDYEIEVMVKDIAKLNEVIRDIREHFWQVIEHYRFHRFYTIKQVYLPGMR